MEKKRSIGITIVGVIQIIFGIQGTFSLLRALLSFQITGIIFGIWGPFLIWLGIGMLNLKSFARKANLFMAPVFSLVPLTFIVASVFNSLGYLVKNNIKVGLWTVGQGWGVSSIGSGIIFILIVLAINFCWVYFLTRPKVKEQFK